jgi:hypothetical protein
VLLNERDAITTPLIQQILCAAVADLSPIQRDLIDGFFLAKIKAPMHCFKLKYSMSSIVVGAEIGDALVRLHQHFRNHGITLLRDFCAD